MVALGLGTCVKSCPFDAMTMSDDGLPIIDPEKCTACGKCVSVCPKQVITSYANWRKSKGKLQF